MNMYEMCVLAGLQIYCTANINCVKSIFYSKRENSRTQVLGVPTAAIIVFLLITVIAAENQ